MASFEEERKVTNPVESDGIFSVDYVFKSDFKLTSREYVVSEVSKSKCLGWSWYHVKSGVYHTGILIYLDGEPRFSVNWGPKGETNVLSTLVEDVQGEITLGIEKSGKENMSYKEVLGSVDTATGYGAERAETILNVLLSYEEARYHAVRCNCRKHVVDILTALGLEDKELNKVMEGLREVKTWAERTIDNIYDKTQRGKKD